MLLRQQSARWWAMSPKVLRFNDSNLFYLTVLCQKQHWLCNKTKAKSYWANGSLECIFLHGSWFVSSPCQQNCPVPKWVGIKKGTEKACLLLQVYFYISSNYFRAAELLLGKRDVREHFFPFLICSPRIGNGRQRSKRRGGGWPPRRKKCLKKHINHRRIY